MPQQKKSDLSRAFAEDGALKTHVGGQALLEGVMMRGKLNWSVAVREPNGRIYTEDHDLPQAVRHSAWLSWPIVRGCRAFVESLAIGYKALEVAVAHAFDDEEPAGDRATAAPAAEEAKAFAAGGPVAADATGDEGADEGDAGLSGGAMTASMVAGLALGVVLFVVLPAFAANLIVGEYDRATFAWNLVDGVVRVALFVGYIWLIGRMRDIDRMFAYHGAEHKTIHCYEHGLPLTPANAAAFPRLHVRCGTAFLIMVMIIAIVVYTLVPLDRLILAWGVPDGAAKLALVIVVRILLMPLIAGISYEITVKWAGSHPENPLVKVVLWPGMQMQYLTTREPDAGQLECAIAAMKLVLEREGRAAAGEGAPRS